MAILNVTGAYLNSNIPRKKIIVQKIEGEFVDILCEVNPEQTQNVRTENWVKVLQIHLMKALYGSLES